MPSKSCRLETQRLDPMWLLEERPPVFLVLAANTVKDASWCWEVRPAKGKMPTPRYHRRLGHAGVLPLAVAQPKKHCQHAVMGARNVNSPGVLRTRLTPCLTVQMDLAPNANNVVGEATILFLLRGPVSSPRAP